MQRAHNRIEFYYERACARAFVDISMQGGASIGVSDAVDVGISGALRERAREHVLSAKLNESAQ